MASSNALGQDRRHLVDLVEGEPVLPHVERLGARPAPRASVTVSGCQTMTSFCSLPSCAAAKNASQSMPGAFFAKSAGFHGLLAVELSSHLLDRLRAHWRSWSRARRSVCARACGFGQAGERQHLCDVRACRLPRIFAISGVRREVIVAVRQPEAALHQIGHSFRRVGERLSDEHAEQVFGLEGGGVERIDVGADGRPMTLRQLRACSGLPQCDPASASGRRMPALVDRVGVRVGRIIVRDARLVRARGGVRIGRSMDEVSEALLGLLVDDVAGADARPVGRECRPFCTRSPLA